MNADGLKTLKGIFDEKGRLIACNDSEEFFDVVRLFGYMERELDKAEICHACKGLGVLTTGQGKE